MKVSFNPGPGRDPERVDGIKVHYGPSRRPFPRLRWYLLILVVSSPLLYFVALYVRDRVIVSARGVVSPPVFVSLRAADEALVKKIHVSPGQEVSARQLLLELDSSMPSKPSADLPLRPPTSPVAEQIERVNTIIANLKGELERARQQVEYHRQRLERMESLRQQTAVNSAGELERARQQIEHYRERLEKMETLRQQGAATIGEVAPVRAQYLAALDAHARLERDLGRDLAIATEVENARQQYQVALDHQARVERDLAMTEKDRAALQRELATVAIGPAARVAPQGPVVYEDDSAFGSRTGGYLRLRERVREGDRYLAPRPGTVLDVYVKEGELVARGAALLALALKAEADITAFLDPKHLRYAAPGTAASAIFPDGARLPAEVLGLEEFTQKPPPEAPEVLGFRRVSLVVKLRCLKPIPAQSAISGLPVIVRFHSAGGARADCSP